MSIKKNSKLNYSNNFRAFVAKAYMTVHGEDEILTDPYIDYLTFELTKLFEGKTTRLSISLPPRHLKSFLIQCFVAWSLAKNPRLKILMLSYSQKMAGQMGASIRNLMNSGWYSGRYTRLSKSQFSESDFATVEGGCVIATSIWGSVTGRGADIIIVDDPAKISQCDNVALHEKIYGRFRTEISSRLNNASSGKIVVIAHRLNELDLIGYLGREGGWKMISLAAIATAPASYQVGENKLWRREEGDLLRRAHLSLEEIEKRRESDKSPTFETLYQQQPQLLLPVPFDERFITIRSEPINFDAMPIVVSVDPAQGTGERNSYAVIQAWSPTTHSHHLIENLVLKGDFIEVSRQLRRLIARRRPSVVLIEECVLGQSLASLLRRQDGMALHMVPVRESKIARFAQALEEMKRRPIIVDGDAAWLRDFKDELANFPQSDFDDQVDATSLYLRWMTDNKIPKPRAPAAIGGAAALASRVNRPQFNDYELASRHLASIHSVMR